MEGLLHMKVQHAKRLLRTVLVATTAVVLVTAGTALAARYRDISEFSHVRKTNPILTDYTASADISKATLQSQNYFKVNTNGGAVDLDFCDNAALDVKDVGSEWVFQVRDGGTNALTVTAGASGVTTVKTLNTLGSTCEDVGDTIRVIAYSTTQATVITACAD